MNKYGVSCLLLIYSILFTNVTHSNAEVKNVLVGDFEKELKNISPIPVYWRDHNKDAVEVATFYKTKKYPEYNVTPPYIYMSFSPQQKCAEVTYNPGKLFATIALFPLAVVGRGGPGSWSLHAGETRCKEGTKIYTAYTMMHVGESTTIFIVCGDQHGKQIPQKQCIEAISKAFKAWTPNIQYVEFKDAKLREAEAAMRKKAGDDLDNKKNGYP